MTTSRRAPSSFSSEAARFGVFVGVFVLCFLLGGGARADIASLVLLRPLCVLALGYAIVTLQPGDAARVRVPLALLCALAALMALQLVPLPFAVWSRLPGHAIVAQIQADTPLGTTWRPLSLAPSATLNSLFALSAPIAALLLLSGLRASRGVILQRLVLGAALASAVLGILQLLGPPQSAFYLYRITNYGSAVGLFANRNHNAVFLASAIPLVAYGLLSPRKGGRQSEWVMRLAIGSAAGALLLLMTFATGSRAGTILSLCAVLACAAIAVLAAPTGRQAKLAIGVSALCIVALAGLAFLSGRSGGLDRILGDTVSSDTRVRILPQLWQMVQSYFPTGSGFGSFYLAYFVVEPRELLQGAYLNQAHDDLLQLAIEGGLPALLLLAGGLAWVGWSGWTNFRRLMRVRSAGEGEVPLAVFAWISLVVLLAASLFDYPLRTPALMLCAVVYVWLCEGPARSPDRSARP